MSSTTRTAPGSTASASLGSRRRYAASPGGTVSANTDQKLADPRVAIQKALGLDEPIELVTRPFVHDDAPITMVMSDGTSIRWAMTRDLFDPKSLFRPFAMRGIARPAALAKPNAAWDVATLICAAAGMDAEHDEHEEARGWGIAAPQPGRHGRRRRRAPLRSASQVQGDRWR